MVICYIAIENDPFSSLIYQFIAWRFSIEGIYKPSPIFGVGLWQVSYIVILDMFVANNPHISPFHTTPATPRNQSFFSRPHGNPSLPWLAATMAAGVQYLSMAEVFLGGTKGRNSWRHNQTW